VVLLAMILMAREAAVAKRVWHPPVLTILMALAIREAALAALLEDKEDMAANVTKTALEILVEAKVMVAREEIKIAMEAETKVEDTEVLGAVKEAWMILLEETMRTTKSRTEGVKIPQVQ